MKRTIGSRTGVHPKNLVVSVIAELTCPIADKLVRKIKNHIGEGQWQAYFRRTLPDTPLQNRIVRYEHHMKFGPTRDYWTEFVLEAYVNHRTEAIFLVGLPGVPESRPHSGGNSQ